MKPSNKLKIFGLAAAIICLGVFVFAIIKSSEFSSVAGPKLTQHSVSQKLYHRPQKSAKTPAKSLASNNPSASTPKPPASSNTPATTPDPTLPNSGPGDTLALFGVASLVGAVLAYAKNLSRVR